MKYMMILALMFMSGCATTTTQWEPKLGFDTFNALERTQGCTVIGFRSDGVLVWKYADKASEKDSH